MFNVVESFETNNKYKRKKIETQYNFKFLESEKFFRHFERCFADDLSCEIEIFKFVFPELSIEHLHYDQKTHHHSHFSFH